MNNKEEEAIERCNQLIKVEHANWIGISNQKAIEIVLNLIQTQQEEIEQSNKVIDKRNEEKIELVEMCLKKDKIIDEIVKELYKKANISKKCYLQTSIEECLKNKNCIESLKEYFINKVKAE